MAAAAGYGNVDVKKALELVQAEEQQYLDVRCAVRCALCGTLRILLLAGRASTAAPPPPPPPPDPPSPPSPSCTPAARRTAEEFAAGHPPGAVNVPVWLKQGGQMVPNPAFLEQVRGLGYVALCVAV